MWVWFPGAVSSAFLQYGQPFHSAKLNAVSATAQSESVQDQHQEQQHQQQDDPGNMPDHATFQQTISVAENVAISCHTEPGKKLSILNSGNNDEFNIDSILQEFLGQSATFDNLADHFSKSDPKVLASKIFEFLRNSCKRCEAIKMKLFDANFVNHSCTADPYGAICKYFNTVYSPGQFVDVDTDRIRFETYHELVKCSTA